MDGTSRVSITNSLMGTSTHNFFTDDDNRNVSGFVLYPHVPKSNNPNNPPMTTIRLAQNLPLRPLAHPVDVRQNIVCLPTSRDGT